MKNPSCTLFTSFVEIGGRQLLVTAAEQISVSRLRISTADTNKEENPTAGYGEVPHHQGAHPELWKR